MKKYELMIIVSPTLTSDEHKELQDTVKKELVNIVYEEVWGERDMAYTIKRQSKGYYVVYNFTSDGTNIHTINEHLTLNPAVLRHLILSVPDDYTPITLQEIEVGLENLRLEKAKDREQRFKGPKKQEMPERRVVRSRPVKKEEEVEEKPQTSAPTPQPKSVESTKSEPKPTPASEPTTVPVAEQKEAPSKKEKKTTLEELDAKLDKMFESDDIDLGF